MNGISIVRTWRILAAALGVGLLLATPLPAQLTVLTSTTYTGQSFPGDISVPNGVVATFTGGTTFAGTTATLGVGSGIYWQQTGSLTGKTVSMDDSSFLYVNGTGYGLTLDGGTTVTGDISIYSNGAPSTSITNAGTLLHNRAVAGEIYASLFTNSGTIEATDGFLYLNYPGVSYAMVNTGTVTATGASTVIYLRGNVDNNGVVTAQNGGRLIWDGNNTTANLGTVTLASGGSTLLNGNLDNSAGPGLSAPTGGMWHLYGGTISGGTVNAGALAFTTSGGTLSNVTYTGDLNLTTTSEYVRFTNGTTFTGANASFANSSALYWQQVGALSGKAITLGNGAYLHVAGVNNQLTLDATTAVTGSISIYADGSAGTAITNAGSLTHNLGSGQIYAETFTNTGSITATAGTLYLNYPSASYSAVNSGSVVTDGANTWIYIRGNFDNNGMLTAQNGGRFIWDGNTTTANLGSVTLTGGGSALLNGVVDNSVGPGLSAPTGGQWSLYGGTISGGTVNAGALAFTTSGGYLSNVVYTGDLNLTASSQHVRFTNGTTFTGANASFANSTGLYWQQVGTLSGKAITLGSGAGVYVSGVNSTLTLDAATSVTGTVSLYADGSAGTAITNAGTLTHNSGTGQLHAETFTNTGAIAATGGTLYFNYPSASYNAVNTGTVVTDGGNTWVYLRGNFDNNGTLTAQNGGRFVWDGSTTTANLGSLVLATGGQALLNGTLDNSVGPGLSAPSGGQWSLYGGTINGGTTNAGALAFTTSGGYLSNVTYTGDLNFTASSQHVHFTDGTTFTGANASFAPGSALYWRQVGTLSGKAITLGSGAYLHVYGVGNKLTLDATTAVTGTVTLYADSSAGTEITNAGTLTHNTGTGQIYAETFTNTGAISATAGTLYLNYPSPGYNAVNTGTVVTDGANTWVYLRGNFDNNGTLTAQNGGRFLWDGSTTTANLGNVVLASGGQALLNGTVDNSVGPGLSAPSGGQWSLYGGTISGGTINAGALAFTTSGGYLSNATYAGDLNLTVSGQHVRFTNGATFTGANASFATGTGLHWHQVGTLSGKTLSFGSGSYLYMAGANSKVTLDATTTATGVVAIYSDGSAGTEVTNAGTIIHNADSAQMYADLFTNDGTILANGGTLYLNYPGAGYDMVNNGAITADGTSTQIYLRGNFDNNGTITAQNGAKLYWDGSTTTANLGNVILSSGRALLNGTLDNSAGPGLSAPSGGIFELLGGTITGGTINPGALMFTNSGGTLFDVIHAGDLLLPASASVTFAGTSDFTGANLTIPNGATVNWNRTSTFTGRTISMGAAGSYGILGVGANQSLTLGSGTTVAGTFDIYGNANSVITNQGTITHTSGTSYLYGPAVINQGTVNAQAGAMYLGYYSGDSTTNAAGGVINGLGATIYAPTPLANSGTLNLQAGTLYTYNTLTNHPGGTIKGSGTFNGDVTVAGGTLAPGNSIGTMTFQSSDFMVTGPAVLEIELGGAASDRIAFVNPGTVDLGAGLLQLSLSLLSAPTPGATYTLMTFSTGSYTGYFQGLASSGDFLTASFGADSYTFQIEYLADSVLLAVPEPSTYALIGVGLLAMGLRVRRQRSQR